MIIKEINIKSFGPLIDKTITPVEGLNIIEGCNESGKSTVAMFIKYMLYGLNAKPVVDDSVSEKAHYVNWDTGMAQGSMVFEAKDGLYRIERMTALRSSLDGKEIYHESSKLIDLSTGFDVKIGKSVGEYFFGLPEKVFMQSAFVKSIGKTRVDGADLKVALENLASSGDEEINTKKALERIDAARKLLKHKNGLGGKIVELSDEKRELSEVLEKSRDISKEIVDVEGTLAEVLSKIKTREEEEVELSALCHAYEAVRTGARVKEIETLEESIGYLEKELGTIDPSINRSFLAKLDLCEGAVRDTERDIKTLSEKRRELEEKCRDRDIDEPDNKDEVMRKAKKLKGFSTFFLSAACTLFAFAAVSVAALLIFGGVMRSVSFGLFTWIIIIAASFFVLSGAGVFLFLKNDKEFCEYLEKYNADDIYTLENAVIIKQEKFRYTKKLLDKMVTIDAVFEEAVTKHDREIDNGFAYAASLGVEGDTVFEALEEAKKRAEDICIKKETMSAKYEGAKGRLSALLEEVGEVERDKAGEAEAQALENLDREKIFAMSKDQYLEAVRQRDFASSQIKALRTRETDLEKKLAALRAAGMSPSEIASRISCIDAKISALSFKHKALMVAYGALERAGEKMRNDIMPQVATRASEIISGTTAGKYASLYSKDDLKLSVNIGDEKKTVDVLSEGTKDAAYIGLRAALVEFMFINEAPPMIFDECFSRIDEKRVKGLLSVVSQKGFPQSFVFTCRSLEGESVPSANLILM